MDARVKTYNSVFDELQQQFMVRAAGDTLVVVHRIWKGVDEIGKDLQDLGDNIFWSFHSHPDI